MKTRFFVIGGVCGLAVGCIFFLDHISSEKSTIDVVPDVAEWTSGPGPAAEPAIPDQEVVLDADKQKRIWDAEHATFEIESQLGPLLLKAIEKQDVEQLTQHCRPDFKGTLPSEFTLVERHKPPLSEWSLPSEFKSAESHAPETMAWLVQQNKNLQKIERRRLRVLKIENQTTDASLWKCRFLVTFSGLDKNGGHRLVETENLVSVRFSTKQELVTSPVLESWAIASQTERLCTHSMMQEITDAAGLSTLPIPDNWNLPHTKVTQYRFQIAVEDFDRDGDMDIAVATADGERLVLVNDGKAVFSNQTSQLGLPQQDSAVANLKFMSVWFDYDNDGYPDLLSGAQLFHNEEGKRFTDVTRESGLSFDPETMGATVADYDSDGLLDLYVLYQKPFDRNGKDRQKARWVNESDTGKQNELWRNLGSGQFMKVTYGARAGGYRRHTHAAAFFHYDDDHHPDLYIANDFGRNVLLRNTGDGKFEDVTEASGAGGFATSMGVCTGDIDNDGATDIYVANMYSKMGRRIIEMVSEDDYPPGIFEQIKGSCAGNQLYTRDSSSKSTYHEVSAQSRVNAVGWAWGPAMFDADNDGLLDLYATSGFLSFDRKKPDG